VGGAISQNVVYVALVIKKIGCKIGKDFCVLRVAIGYSSIVTSYQSTHCSPRQLQPESVGIAKNIIPHAKF
jgi:hypothetical protein